MTSTLQMELLKDMEYYMLEFQNIWKYSFGRLNWFQISSHISVLNISVFLSTAFCSLYLRNKLYFWTICPTMVRFGYILDQGKVSKIEYSSLTVSHELLIPLRSFPSLVQIHKEGVLSIILFHSWSLPMILWNYFFF